MPPTGVLLTIDGSATVTGDYLVDLGITATGATEMRFSNAAPNYSAWEPFNASKLAWDIRGYGGNDFEGIHTVWCSVRNAIDERVSVFASIEYRRAKPSIRIYPKPVQRAGNHIVDIKVDLFDPHYNPVNVIQAEYTLDGTFTDGGNITFMPNDSLHDGVTDLPTAPNGVTHNLVWNLGEDVQDDVSDICQIRMKVQYANELSETGTSQQFAVDTRIPIEEADLEFTRGDAAEIKLTLLDRMGAPFDATGNVEVTSIKDPSGTEMLTIPIVSVNTSTGYYVATYNIGNTAPLGLWTSTWTYTADFVSYTEAVYFKVVEEAEQYVPLGSDTCVVYGQLLKADQNPMSEIEVHFIPHHLSDPELGNPTVISTDPVITYTDTNGRFKVELMRNTELIIYIPKLSFRQFAKVPDQDTSEFRAMMTLLPVPPRDQFGNRV